jgi:general nucleoside transport system permease protein
VNFVLDILQATFRTSTPIVYAAVGDTYVQRAGMLNLGIEGMMFAGAFFGFLAGYQTGSLWLGLAAAAGIGLLSAAVLGFLVITLGTSQHVAGIGMTLLLIAVSEFTNRLVFGRPDTLPKVETFDLHSPFDFRVLDQYGMTYVALLLLVPAAWWVLNRSSFGLRVRAVGENPEAADVAGINVFLVRYAALLLGGALAAIGGAFLTLAVLGSFTLDIVAGRGWVALAMVIFGRWMIGRAVLGVLLFAAVSALQLRLRILPGWDAVPFELLLALPYVAVLVALALAGRNVAYPGAYLRPYRRT